MPSFPGGVFGGTVVPLDRRNVDTDAIIPQEHCRASKRVDLGAFLFRRWRDEQPGFVLGDPRYAGARVLLARENFGCGSSREHAVWALRDWGIRAIVAPSFGDILRGNCALNGVAAVALRPGEVQALFEAAAAGVLQAQVDVLRGELRAAGRTFPFALAERERLLLTSDVDWIGATLARRELIAGFEARRLAAQPWLGRVLER